MKLAKLQRGERTIWAAVTDAGAVDLSSAIDGDIRNSLDTDSLKRLADFAAERPVDIAAGELSYASFLPNPEKIICVGVNYTNRNEEYRDGSDLPKYPSLFIRAPTSFVGHNAPLLRPRESEQLDYEGELAIIVGKGGRRIAKDQALGHVAGLTLVNEGTLRDWVRHAKFNVTQGKNFDSSGSIGPWMVTADEFDGFDAIPVQTRVNGDLRQDDTTASLIFSFADLIAYISSFTTLKAGDVISTGTPSGVGAAMNPPTFLKAGDTVRIAIDKLGELRNPVVAEPAETDVF